LDDQQAQNVSPDAVAVLKWPGEALRKRAMGWFSADRAGLDFGVDVSDDLLEDDVDLGSPLVLLARDIPEIFAVVGAKTKFDDFDLSVVRALAELL
jgi:hypothetical protein